MRRRRKEEREEIIRTANFNKLNSLLESCPKIYHTMESVDDNENGDGDRKRPSVNGGDAVHETEDDVNTNNDNNNDNTKSSNRKSPYHHSHQISYEDMSRSMSAMWAGCTMIETEDTDDDDSRKAEKMRRKSIGKSNRRSKSVDFDNVSGVVGKDMEHTVKNRSSSTLKKTSDGQLGNTRAHDRTEGTRETNPSSQQQFPTTVDQFMSDATATVSLRKRLKRMLQRRDAAARKVNEMLSSPHYTTIEDSEEAGVSTEIGTSDHRLLRKEAEVLRENIRKRKLSLSVRRTYVERRYQLISEATSVLSHAKSRLFSAQELLEFGQCMDKSGKPQPIMESDLPSHQLEDRVANNLCDDRIQGVPRLLCLEKKLRARRCYMVLELSKIFPIASSPQQTVQNLQKSSRTKDSNSSSEGSGQEPLLSICGITLARSQGLNVNNNGNSRRRLDKSECESFGAALGYVAHAVNLIGTYYGVPLRYNLNQCASRSVVVDLAPPVRLNTLHEVAATSQEYESPDANGSSGRNSSSRYFGRASPHNNNNNNNSKDPHGLSGQQYPNASSPPRPLAYPNVELPLHLENVNHNEFHAAVWLLNKDIEQLLGACGEKSVGYKMHHTLENLRRLYLCVQHAPPQENLQNDHESANDDSNSSYSYEATSSNSMQISLSNTMTISPSFQAFNRDKDVLRSSMDEAAILESLNRLRLMSV